MGANSSHVVISMLNNDPMAIYGRAEFSGFNTSGNYIDTLIGFNYRGIPSKIQSTTTKALSSKNIYEQIGDFQKNLTVIPSSKISLLNFSSPKMLKTDSFASTSSLTFTSTTDQEMYATINLYIDNYLANDPTNGLYILPDWSDMYSYMDSKVSGDSWMPYTQLNLQHVYYGNPKVDAPYCNSYDYSNDWTTFINSFQLCGKNGKLQGGSNNNVDASFIMSGYQNFKGGAYGISVYAPTPGSMWGVFGYYNPNKNTQAYAGVANGYWVAGNVPMRIAHEFGHLMGGAHEPGDGATYGPDCNWPYHGATDYCTGLLCGVGIGYKNTIMDDTTIDNNLAKSWAFSSDYETIPYTEGWGPFTASPYNSNPINGIVYDNLFYVRGTAWNYCRNA